MKEWRTHLCYFELLLIAQEDDIKMLVSIEDRTKNRTDFFGESSVRAKFGSKTKGHADLSLQAHLSEISSIHALIMLKKFGKAVL